MNLKKMLSVALSGCLILTGGIFGGLKQETAEAVAVKSRVSVHDPSIFKDKNGMYYVFGSHIEAAKSNNLQNWTRFTNGYATTNNVLFGNLSQNLAGAFAWAGENLEDCEGGFAVWAPDVIYNPDYVNKDGSKGAYMMYFCTTSTYMRSVIAFGVSKTPEGPYTFVDNLIYSGFTSNDSYATSSTKNVNRKYTSTNIDELIASGQVTYNSQWFSNSNFNNYEFPNAIDPTIYYKPDGTMYMCYGSWSGGIFTIQIDPKTGKCIHPKTGKTSDGRIIDSYFGTKISGGCFKSGEGPFMEYNPETGYYYLWVTYGGLTATGGYNMRVFRSKNADGPFYDAAGQPAVLSANTNLDSVGLKVMGNYKFSSLPTAYMACGHNSVLHDDDGKWYLLNHARFNNGTEFHEVRVHSMYFNSEGWPVVAPYEYSGDVMAQYGYETADIVGTYEYINHGNDTSATIHEYKNINLNADGTISGGATGTWSQANNSAQAKLVIDGKTYNGYFLAAQDETGKEKKVMSFTAVGSNNQTVWGAQTKAFTGKGRNEAAAAATFSAASYFRIKNANSGLYLDVDGAKAENNANVQQWGATDAVVQNTWRFVDAGDGYYYIQSMVGDKTYVMDVAGSKTENGTNIGIYTFKGNDNQKFMITKNADGSYKISPKISNGTRYVEIASASTTAGDNCQIWENTNSNCQDWIMEEVTFDGEAMDTSKNYMFKNASSGLYMEVANGSDADGTNVQQWEANGTGENKSGDWNSWTLKHATADLYYIVSNLAEKRYLTVNDGNLEISARDSSTNVQMMRFVKNPDGTYSIYTRTSFDKTNNRYTKAVEVENASSELGANVKQWDVNGASCQKWVVEAFTTTAATTTVTTKTTTTTTTTTTTSKVTTTAKPIVTTVKPIETTVVTTKPVEPGIVVGDVNDDGKLDVADIVMLKKYLVKQGELKDYKAADINKDSKINVFDFMIIKKTISK